MINHPLKPRTMYRFLTPLSVVFGLLISAPLTAQVSVPSFLKNRLYVDLQAGLGFFGHNSHTQLSAGIGAQLNHRHALVVEYRDSYADYGWDDDYKMQGIGLNYRLLVSGLTAKVGFGKVLAAEIDYEFRYNVEYLGGGFYTSTYIGYTSRLGITWGIGATFTDKLRLNYDRWDSSGDGSWIHYYDQTTYFGSLYLAVGYTWPGNGKEKRKRKRRLAKNKA